MSASVITQTDFHFNGQTAVYHGKVRDVYFVKEKLVIIASDRISAFDHILPRAIPFKGQVLNLIAKFFLENTKDICPNWWEQSPHPAVSIGKKCEPIRVEVVVRGYLAGYAAREYAKGIRKICGISLPDGLQENQQLPTPIITPTAKNMEGGHDEDITREEIIERGIVAEKIYSQVEKYALALFERGTAMAKEKGLLLVDTKYEFGLYNGEVYLIDEIHTPDSSRYFYADGYAEKLAAGEPQRQLSKEFVREWLIENGFQGKEGQQIPQMSDEFVVSITDRYIELYEKITGNEFDKKTKLHLSEALINQCLE